MITLNGLLLAYCALYIASFLFDVTIDKLNANYLRKFGKEVPDAFKGMIDADELQKIRKYTLDKIHFSFFQTSSGKIFFLFIILSGILPWFAQKVGHFNYLAGGLLFFSGPSFVMALVDMPFDLYHSFVLEERYGFNTKTFKIWLSDVVKSILVIIILGGLLLSALLLLLHYAGKFWWIWTWAVVLGFQLLMTVLYPTIIAPLFNKFSPLEESDLKRRIEQLAHREGLTIRGIYQMDASKRSRHTNAYLSGLGKAKRIVLFDSLLQSHSEDEILGVLAHEIGHLKKNHIKKHLALFSIISLLFFYVASKLIAWDLMYFSFGFSALSPYVGLFLLGVLWGPIGYFLSPLMMAISRKFEWEADMYAFTLMKNAEPLTLALKKMAKDNLSNLTPHRLNVWFNYSHPPLLERITYLTEADSFESHDN
ncbi:MAG: M48 family metallopeptidase [bacterium]